jgi:hypothetical protein
MTGALRLGRWITVPSPIEIKHQLLMPWLKDQTTKEAAASEAAATGPKPASASADRHA